MPWSTIEHWDESGNLVSRSRDWIEQAAPVMEVLQSTTPHTVTVEIEDDGCRRLLIAARDRSAFVGWTDPEDCNYQLVGQTGRDDEVEMSIGGQATHLAGRDLVPAITAELAIREFLGAERGSLGLVWNAL